MTVALVVVSVLAGVLVAALAVERAGVLRRRRHQPFIITMKTGPAFKGLLASEDTRALVLVNVEAVDGDKLTPVDGEVIVPWADVKYLQKL